LYRDSLRLLREHGDQRCVASVLSNLGALALAGPDPAAAEPVLRESLALRRRLGDQAGIAECLEGYAALAERQGDPTGAVRLLGAADAVRERTGAARPESDDREHEARVAALRAAIGTAAYDAAWADGRGRDEEAVIAMTWGANGPPPDRNRPMGQPKRPETPPDPNWPVGQPKRPEPPPEGQPE
jgi:hypothetical protein